MNIQPYKSLFLTVFFHFFVMYALTMVVVNEVADIKLFNLRSLYMAVIMVVPMVVFMLFFMKKMYESKKLNLLLYVSSLAVFAAVFVFIRQQVFVGNEQFLKSMIPHHSSAITMCRNASITDQEIQSLCRGIVESQQQEIEQMNKILNRLESSE